MGIMEIMERKNIVESGEKHHKPNQTCVWEISGFFLLDFCTYFYAKGGCINTTLFKELTVD
jgi:hypothetical protein